MFGVRQSNALSQKGNRKILSGWGIVLCRVDVNVAPRSSCLHVHVVLAGIIVA